MNEEQKLIVEVATRLLAARMGAGMARTVSRGMGREFADIAKEIIETAKS